jgi:general secretion pathway protein G
MEVIVVLSIIAILAMIGIQAYIGYMEKARVLTAVETIAQISAELSHYGNERGYYPQSLNEIGYGGITDPWGNSYQYLNLASARRGQMRKDRFLVPINTDFDLYSMGKDGESIPPLTAKKSRDDVIRANDGNYIGLAEGY